MKIRERSTLLLFCLFLSFTASAQNKQLIWEFPLERPHTGVTIGNGIQGLMIWGGGNHLNITIGHGGFWDHRSRNDLDKLTTFSDLKDLLYANKNNEVKSMFAFSPNASKGRTRQIGGGRFVVSLPENYQLLKASLNLLNGRAVVYFSNPKGKLDSLYIEQAISQPVARLLFPQDLNVSLKLIPTWNYVGSTLAKMGIKPPFIIEGKDGVKGFVQTLPEDMPLALGYRQIKGKVLFGSVLEKQAETGIQNLLRMDKVEELKKETALWWKTYWSDVPKVSLPDPVLQEILDYGLYKQAGSTPPHAKAAGLQGPFMEDQQLAPWTNDYHFNINVQMMYEPVLPSNRAEHFMPLWTMINSWLPEFRKKGEHFYNHKGALFFPFATDDRGQLKTDFWTGIIDKSSAAWMANLAWRHYRYTMDKSILDTIAWPLLVGSFETYWATLEEVDDGKGGKRLSLPVTISPEYGGALYGYKRAWGRDSSFELAALHSIASILSKAAAILGKPQDPRWKDVEHRLPQYTTIDGIWMKERGSAGKRIALWEDQDLDGSHRHHSHLAGIYPFCTIDPKEDRNRSIVNTTIRNWVFKGAGNWAGWSIPWASTIWSRLDNPEAAVMWLHYWVDNYVNEGRGTLYESAFQGQTLLADNPWSKRNDEPVKEKMQLDAAMGAVTAIFEMLVQQRNDVLVVLPAIHKDWKKFEFEDILAEGAFLVSAKVEAGKTKEIRVRSTKGGLLKLEHKMGERCKVNGKSFSGAVFEKNTVPNEVLVFTND